MRHTFVEPKLPSKLSELIMVALEDIESLSRSPRVKIAPSETYCDVTESKRGLSCVVCVAGAVMLRRALKDLKPSGDPGCMKSLQPEDFTAPNQRAFHALNQIRVGRVDSALKCLRVLIPEHILAMLPTGHFGEIRPIDEANFVPYEENKKAWTEQMIFIAGVLDAEGL